jgi:hypothetical protein
MAEGFISDVERAPKAAPFGTPIHPFTQTMSMDPTGYGNFDHDSPDSGNESPASEYLPGQRKSERIAAQTALSNMTRMSKLKQTQYGEVNNGSKATSTAIRVYADGRSETITLQRGATVLDLKTRVENSRGFPAELQRISCENFDRTNDITIGELHDIMRQKQPADAELIVRVKLKVKGGMLKAETKEEPTSDSEETAKLTADPIVTQTSLGSAKDHAGYLDHLRVGTKSNPTQKGFSFTGDPVEFNTMKYRINAILHGVGDVYNKRGKYTKCIFTDKYAERPKDEKEAQAWEALRDRGHPEHLAMYIYTDTDTSYKFYLMLFRQMSQTDIETVRSARDQYGYPKEMDGFGLWGYFGRLQERKAENSAHEYETQMDELVYTRDTYFDEFQTRFIELRRNGEQRDEKKRKGHGEHANQEAPGRTDYDHPIDGCS